MSLKTTRRDSGITRIRGDSFSLIPVRLFSDVPRAGLSGEDDDKDDDIGDEDDGLEAES